MNLDFSTQQTDVATPTQNSIQLDMEKPQLPAEMANPDAYKNQLALFF